LSLRDLVSYNSDTSWDCRTPGWSDSQVEALRNQQQRNFLTSLLVSIGVPLVQGGSEIGRSQQGNANAYDEDNATSWYHVDLTADQQALLDFTRQVIALRKAHPILRRSTFLQGAPAAADLKDVSWHRPDGAEMGAQDWADGNARVLGVRFAGDAAEPDDQGQPRPDDPLLILVNAWWGELGFVLPSAGSTRNRWELVLDTSAATVPALPPTFNVGQSYALGPRSTAVLRGRSG